MSTRSSTKSNYKHTKIFKIFDEKKPNEIYLSVSGNQLIKISTILKNKYNCNKETSKRGHKEFFRNKNLKIEFMDEMNIRTKAEVLPHLYLFCERLNPKYTVINKPKLLL